MLELVQKRKEINRSYVQSKNKVQRKDSLTNKFNDIGNR